MSQKIKIKVFNNNKLADVFYGSMGFEPCARFQLSKSKNGVFVKQVGGAPVPQFVMTHVIKEVNHD